MRTFEATCKIVTPLFMGGASQQAELRTQSINGVLRWWFRVAGGSLEDEKRIFGWAGETSNQGLVRISIKDFDKLQKNKFSKEFDDRGRVRQNRGINYIGFSLDQRFRIDQQDKIRREYIRENQTFNLKISFHPKATDDDIKKFFSALWLAFNLGNFGSRARRGFGAIRIEEIKEKGSPITNNCYGLNFIPSGDLESWIKGNLEKIKEILKPNPRKDIPYLFENFEIYDFKSDNSWQNLLNEVGIKYKNFRQNVRLNDRIVFGLPIIAIGKYRIIRRSSPLTFKVINTDKNNYTLLIIIIKPNTHKFIFHPDIKEDVKWDLLTNFVKSITSKRRIYP
jgi:CRISPR-associated protein Cmr1